MNIIPLINEITNSFNDLSFGFLQNIFNLNL